MRSREFIVEYRRNITAQKLGNKILSAALQDRQIRNVNPLLADLGIKFVESQGEVQQQYRQQLLDLLLQTLENLDPTPNKQYTPWLARMYAQNTWYLEDLNRNNLLGLYHRAKVRRMLKPQHADINQFANYASFENTMSDQYDADRIMGQSTDEVNRGKFHEVYQDQDVRIVIPQDQDAACYFGRGTRWCTAATKSANRFDVYSRRGPLYILIPNQPQSTGEKYQLHFETVSFMDQKDQPINIKNLLENRFPGALTFFQKRGLLASLMEFMSDQNKQTFLNQLSRVVLQQLAYNYYIQTYNRSTQKMEFDKQHPLRNVSMMAQKAIEIFEKMPSMSFDQVLATARDHSQTVYGLQDIPWHFIREIKQRLMKSNLSMDSELIEKLDYISYRVGVESYDNVYWSDEPVDE